MTIPTDFNDFLYWLKEATEKFWSAAPSTSPDAIVCEEWLRNATWIGMIDEQVDAVERKYAIQFTPEHRAFLRILHTTGRVETWEEDVSSGTNAATIIKEAPHFYNWLTDDIYLDKYLTWPYTTILSDVIDAPNVWLHSWGKKPSSLIEQEAIVTSWYDNAPKLLPLTSHTFLVSDAALEKRPVLSVYGSDIIIAGWSLKAYLLSTFSAALGLDEMVYSREDKCYYMEFKKGVLETFSEYFQFELTYPIPYWDEMIR